MQGKLGASAFGGLDIFVARYDSDGARQWVQQIGTRDDDACFELAISEAGFLAVSGGTTGDFAETNLGNRDAILAIFSPKGKLVSKFQLGTSEYDNAMAGAVGNEGNVFLAGETNGYFDKPGALNDSDVFLSKFQVELANPSAAGP